MRPTANCIGEDFLRTFYDLSFKEPRFNLINSTDRF